MTAEISRQTSYSARSTTSSRSISSASAMNMSGGLQLVGAGQTRISNGVFQSRTPSVYGGAGGFGTRISQASQSIYSSGGSGVFGTCGVVGSGSFGIGDASVITNEKVTMQNLNDRLASYLEKVRSLEAANRKLELQIREFYEKRGPSVSRDYSSYFATISDLRAQIQRRYAENNSVTLQIDNARLAAEDFKLKFEMELTMRTNVEGDVARLRGVRDGLTLTISDLQLQIESLKEELVYMKSNHEEEMRLLRVQQTGNVSVEVDSTESVDLTKVLEEMREQYETVMQKNKLEVERWFDSKIEILRKDISKGQIEVKTSSSEVTELKRTYQSLEISRQSALAEIQCLQQSLEEVKSRYGFELSQLQTTINMLETELQQLRVSLEQQRSEYNILLDIKMRLELEIAEYRRLLEGGAYAYQEKKTAVVISKVVEVEEHKPHIERRVKTIVEEIVDGKVVSSSVDTQVEDIQ